MKKILLMQARVQHERAQIERDEFARALPQTALECVSVIDETKPWDRPEDLFTGYDAVFIGGSGDFHLHSHNPSDEASVQGRRILERLRPSIEYLLNHDIPVLGICFGHQLIAETFSGGVTSDGVQAKTGTFAVTLTDAGARDPLFHEFPGSFYAHYAHKNSVTALPRGATLLAQGAQCLYSALRYGPTVYTVQFHPESTRESMISMARRMPQYMPQGKTAEEIFHSPSPADTLLSRFVDVMIKK